MCIRDRETTMQMNQTRKLVYAALCVAVGILLPSIFHATHISGTAFLPMHIPALLCGLLCGPVYGGLCGAVLPFLNVLILGMPPVFPTGISMAVELLCYGVVAGLLIQRFHVYVASVSYTHLVSSTVGMLSGCCASR